MLAVIAKTAQRIAGCAVAASLFGLATGGQSPASAAPASSGQSDSSERQVVALRFDRGGGAAPSVLVGRDSRLQLLVTAETAQGALVDWTDKVEYRAAPAGRVQIDHSGLVTPLTAGEVTITAAGKEGLEATLTLSVRGIDQDAPVSFPTQVIPVFTKLSCNSGGCHGKSDGQNGFKLSLLGFGPRADYQHLVTESRGRRVFPAAPEHSLLLRKATGDVPHGGGQRMKPDSHEYRLLRRWIAQGMPYSSGDEAEVVSIETVPAQRQLQPGSGQQLSTLAHYSDGSVKDVTRAALYESNDPAMATVTETGRVELKEMVGDVAVMARYQGHVAAFRAAIPQATPETGWEPEQWPPPRNLIDRAVYQKLRTLRIPPSPECDDASFLRRVTLDIAGRLPTLEEIDEFQTLPRADRRDRWIQRLLASDDNAEYFANKWNVILRNQREAGGLKFANMAFYQWVRDSFQQNKPYDVFVRQLVTASGSVASNPPVAWFHQVPDTNQRIEDAAQLFLGQRIQCARCHHHPFEKWSQADYAQMAAFFSLVSKKTGDDPNAPTLVSKIGDASSRHPATGETLPPAGLDSDSPKIARGDDPRVHFADWMTDKKNPFFARSLVNRYWKHFMGRGLVEPVDDLRVTNPPSNPALLDAMAGAFVASGYDLKSLIRMICRSQAYQRSSDALPENIGDERCYSRFYPKRLTAEVLLDGIDRVTASPTRFDAMPSGTRAVSLPDTGFDSYFLTVFGRPDASTACECERSQESNLAQSLQLLNSEQMQQKLSSDTGRAAKLAEDQDWSEAEKVRELYRVAFCRPPTDGELESILNYVNGKENRREAYEDLVWSLVNSKEFLFNH